MVFKARLAKRMVYVKSGVSYLIPRNTTVWVDSAEGVALLPNDDSVFILEGEYTRIEGDR